MSDLARRRCPRCGVDQPLTDFGIRAGTRRPTAWCRPCKAAYDRDWYRRKKDERAAATTVRNTSVRARNRLLLERAKDVPCADCGKRYPPFVMDFDHVRGTKRANVSLLAGSGATEAAIEAEIAKCDVVCANCHRERTHGGRRRAAPPALPSETTVRLVPHQLWLAFEWRSDYRLAR